MKTQLFPKQSIRGGTIARVMVVLGVVAVVGAIAWILMLSTVVASVIGRKTGFTVKVDELAVNPFTANVRIKGLVIKNPAGWPSEEFVDLREFRADANLFSLFGNRLLAEEVVVDVAQVHLVRNAQGKLNASVFQESLAGTNETGPKKEPAQQQQFLIRRLVLKLDKMVYVDHSGRSPSTKTYQLNVNREMRDVDSVKKIVSPFAGSALGLVAESLGGRYKVDPGLLKELTETLQDAGKKTGEKLKGLLDSLDKKDP